MKLKFKIEDERRRWDGDSHRTEQITTLCLPIMNLLQVRGPRGRQGGHSQHIPGSVLACRRFFFFFPWSRVGGRKGRRKDDLLKATQFLYLSSGRERREGWTGSIKMMIRREKLPALQLSRIRLRRAHGVGWGLGEQSPAPRRLSVCVEVGAETQSAVFALR